MSKWDSELKYNGAMKSIAIPTSYANIANTSINRGLPSMPTSRLNGQHLIQKG
jgi:hypothetical protein